jgi:multiple sugar transport system substrate-binding protein
MSKQSKNKEAAWRFISYFLSREGMLTYCKGVGFSPVRKSAASDPFFTDDVIKKTYAKQMEVGGFFYFKHPRASEMTPLIRAEVQAAMEGTKTVPQAMNDLQKQLEGVLRGR